MDRGFPSGDRLHFVLMERVSRIIIITFLWLRLKAALLVRLPRVIGVLVAWNGQQMVVDLCFLRCK